MAVERRRKKLNLTLDPETIDFLAWLDDEHKLGRQADWSSKLSVVISRII